MSQETVGWVAWGWLMLLGAGVVLLTVTWRMVERLEPREGGSGAHRWAWGVAKAAAMVVAFDLALTLLGARSAVIDRVVGPLVWVAGGVSAVALVLVLARPGAPEIDGRSPGADPNRRSGRRTAGGERIRMFVS
jgi:hypothetical protein